jgi:hypothetical protein
MSKIKAKAIAFNKDPRKPEVVHVAAVDSRGRIWERYSDMPEGVWGEIPLPDEPNPAENRRRKRASKRPV